MLINNLEKMEAIVSSHKQLEWEGWDVVHYKKSPNSMFSSDGAYKNGNWYKKKSFPITEKGWYIPKGFGEPSETMER